LKAQLAEEKSSYRDALRVANETSSRQLQALQRKYATADQDRVQLERRFHEAQQASEKLHKGHATLNKRLDSMRKEAAKMEAKYSRVQRELEDLKQRKETWRQRKKDLKQRENDLKQREEDLKQQKIVWQRYGEAFQCCKCLDCYSDTLFQPCGHVCVCETCSEEFTRCPICRKNIESKQKLFYS